VNALIFPCENCGSKLRIAAADAGKRVRCPKCGHIQFSSSPAQETAGSDSGGGEDLGFLLGAASASEPVISSSGTAGVASASRGTAKSHTMWIAIGAGGGVAVLVLGLALFFLWPRNDSAPTPAQPQPSDQPQPSAQVKTTPEPPRNVHQPAQSPQVSLGWYARYLPGEPALLATFRPAKVLNSRVFRQATAPVSAMVQMGLLAVQQELGMPVTAFEEVAVAVSIGKRSGGEQDPGLQASPEIDFVVAIRTSVPVNPQIVFADSKSEQIGGQTIYVRDAEPGKDGVDFDNQDNVLLEEKDDSAEKVDIALEGLSNEPPAGAPSQLQGLAALPQQVEFAGWLPDEKTVVISDRETIKKLIERSSEVTVTPTEDLLLALSEVDAPEQCDLLIAASSDLFQGLAPLTGGLAGAGARLQMLEMGGAAGVGASSNNQPPGAPGGAPAPAGPGGAPGQFGPPGFGTGAGGQPALPTQGALAISARAGDELVLRVAIVSQDEPSAGQMQAQVSGLRQMVMFQIQSVLENLQQQAGAQGQQHGQPQQGQPASGKPLQQQMVQKQLNGLKKLREALQEAMIGGHDRLTTVQLSIPGDALAALVLLAMQQQQDQEQQEGPPAVPGFGPPGFPGAPPGFPGIAPPGR